MVAEQKENILDLLSSYESQALSRKQLGSNDLKYLVDLAKDLKLEETLRIKAARILSCASNNLQDLSSFSGDLLTLVRENRGVSPFATDLLRTIISRAKSRGFVLSLLRSIKSSGLTLAYTVSLANQLIRKANELGSTTGRYALSDVGYLGSEKAVDYALNRTKKDALYRAKRKRFGAIKGRM